MDEGRIRTSSQFVQELASSVEAEAKPEDQMHIKYARIYSFLSEFESELTHKYIQNWISEEGKSPEPAGLLIIERPGDLAALVNVIKEKSEYNADIQDVIDRFINAIPSYQHGDGSIPNNHSESLLLLARSKPELPETKKAINHFLNTWSGKETVRRGGIRELASGIHALCEISFERFNKECTEMAKCLDRSLIKHKKDEKLELGDWPGLQEAAIVLSLFPDENFESIKIISEFARENRERLLSAEPLIQAYAGMALIGLGEGPKIPEQKLNWEVKRMNQQLSEIKPQFVSTIPAADLHQRRTEILEKAEMMLSSTENTLRISSHFIDMLYEDIIDLVEEQDVDTRILTRGRELRGSRQRIKTGVLNELIKITEGNVRGNERLHSRMIISDESSLLVSTADLTRDQLVDEYNVGVYTRDSEAIHDAIQYFDSAWKASTSLDTK